MCRRGLTLLLLPAILLTQWVSSSRCMGQCRAVGSDVRPHVHLNAILPRQPEGAGCGCKRQRQANVPTASDTRAMLAAAERTPPPEPTRPGDNQSVLFLSFDVGVACRAAAGVDGVHPDADQLSGCADAGFAHGQERDRCVLQSFSGQSPVSPLPVYLLTLCLRI